jgi:hypothetical protein
MLPSFGPQMPNPAASASWRSLDTDLLRRKSSLAIVLKSFESVTHGAVLDVAPLALHDPEQLFDIPTRWRYRPIERIA